MMYDEIKQELQTAIIFRYGMPLIQMKLLI